MQIRNIDFNATENGFLSLSDKRIRQTEHNLHRIRFYADFETGPTSPYLVSIVMKRADMLEIGPVAMQYAQDENGVWHRYYDIKEQMTEVVGPLAFGVKYEQWEENDEGVLELKLRCPMFVSYLNVYDTNMKVYDKNYDIYQRLNDLEGVNTGYFSERLGIVEGDVQIIYEKVSTLETEIPQIYEAIENIEIGGEGVIKLETLEEANASPKAKKAGSIAFIKM